MCRFVLYLGPELRMSALVTEPANSIIHQSLHSHEREEPLNGDGFGVGWYVEGREEPAVFKNITPAWSNLNLLNLAPVTRTTCLLAHVRAATPGIPVQQLNCHPFSWGPLAFMHNGSVGGFAEIRRELLRALSDEAYTAIHGSTDSEHVFGLVIDEYRAASPGAGSLKVMEAGIRMAIERTERLRQESGIGKPSLLNLAVTDGHRAVVSRYISRDPERANTLYVNSGRRYVCENGICRMVRESKNGHAVIVASEPLSEDEGWEPVPPNHIMLIDDDLSVAIRAL